MRTTTLLATLTCFTALHAQCDNITLPAGNTLAMTTNVELVTGNVTVWVCEGVEVTIFGGQITIVAEENSIVHVNGFLITTYLKPGCTFSQEGSNSTVYTTPGNSITVSDPSIVQVECPSISYDYTNAPPDGCFAPISIAEATVQPQLNIMPDPVGDVLNVRVSKGTLRSAEVLDMSGRHVHDVALSNDRGANVSTLPPGIYLLRARVNETWVLRRFMKQ